MEDNRVRVIVYGGKENRKFIVHEGMTLNEFVFFFRQKMELGKNFAIYLEIQGSKFISFGITIGKLHEMYKSDDNCLYIKYSTEEYMGRL